MGDAVNGHEFTKEARSDPHRLIEAYERSVSTLNLMRAFTTGGFADLSKVHEWNKGRHDESRLRSLRAVCCRD